jgi:hypothetical protein
MAFDELPLRPPQRNLVEVSFKALHPAKGSLLCQDFCSTDAMATECIRNLYTFEDAGPW